MMAVATRVIRMHAEKDFSETNHRLAKAEPNPSRLSGARPWKQPGNRGSAGKQLDRRAHRDD